MVSERRTRATSVAATKEAEPPSRRTRAASVSANRRIEPLKKTVATPKRKRSVSVAASRTRDRADATPKRRESGRAKRVRTGNDAEEPRGRSARRVEELVEDVVLLAEPLDEAKQHDGRIKVFQKDVGIASVKGLSAQRKNEMEGAFDELVAEERRLMAEAMASPMSHPKGENCCLAHQYEGRESTLVSEGLKLKRIKTLEELGWEAPVTQVGRATDHLRKKKAFVKTARAALQYPLSEIFKAELKRMHQEITAAEVELGGISDIGEELIQIGWRLKTEKTLEQHAKEEPPKKDPHSRVKGAYFDTTAPGYVKAPLSARQHRTQQKLIFDEKEKAGKELENLKAEFADSLQFYECGGTNLAMIKGYREFRYELATLEEEYKELENEREDVDKIKSFTAKIERLSEKFKRTEKGNKENITDDVRKKLEKGREVGLIDQIPTGDGTVVEKERDYVLRDSGEIDVVFPDGEVEKIADAPSTAKKPRAAEDQPKKTPRRKSIRMGALSIFTPNGTRANSEAVEHIPSSPLSSPPPIPQPKISSGPADSSLRSAETISWATPVSEIHDFLTACPRKESLEESVVFDPRPIGFKCPGHKREWRGAEQTKELIIYREWLNDVANVGKTEFYGFFMTPRDISKPPTLEAMKSLKYWKAWGAGVVTMGKRTLVIYDPEFSPEEVTKMRKTGELSKMQQLLVGAVKRCRGSCDEVIVFGKTPEDEQKEKEMAVERDSFARTAEWAAKVINDGQMSITDARVMGSMRTLQIAK